MLYSTIHNDHGSLCFAVINKQDPTCLIEDIQNICSIEFGDIFIHIQFKNTKIYSLVFNSPKVSAMSKAALESILDFGTTSDIYPILVGTFKALGRVKSKEEFIVKYTKHINVCFDL